MRKVLGIVAVLTVLGFIGVFNPTNAQSCVRCSNFFQSMPEVEGTGSTCAEAEQNALNNALNDAYSQYDVCHFSVEVTMMCVYENGVWKVRIRIRIRYFIDSCPVV